MEQQSRQGGVPRGPTDRAVRRCGAVSRCQAGPQILRNLAPARRARVRSTANAGLSLCGGIFVAGFLHRIIVESRDLVAAHALGALWIVGAQAFHTPITPSIILASDALFQGVSIAGFGVAQTSKISSGCICRARSPSALIPTLFKRGCRATQASIVRAGNPITSTDQSVRSIYLNVRYGETNYRAWKFMEMSKCQRKAESTSM